MYRKVEPIREIHFSFDREKELKYNLIRTRNKDGKTFKEVLEEMLKS